MFDTPANAILKRCSNAGQEDSDAVLNLLAAYKCALTSHESPNTRLAKLRDLDFYVHYLSDFTGRIPMDIMLNLPGIVSRAGAISYRDYLRSCFSNRGKPYAGSSVNRRLSNLSSLWKEFMAASLCPTNPWRGLRADDHRCDPTPALSLEDQSRLISAPGFESATNAYQRRRLLRDKILLALLFMHGIRREEARLLKFSDIGTNQGYHVFTVKAKRGQVVQFRLHPKVFFYLEVYRREFMSDDGYIFRGFAHNGNSKTGAPMSAQTINYIVKWWAKKVGIKQRVSAHVGRATAITHALRHAPIQVVSRAISHASIETTARYDRTKNRLEKGICTLQDCEV